MNRVKFDPKAVTATLINRVHRTGITMMTIIEKSRNKLRNINPKMIDDLETDYLLANIELENILKTQLAQKKDECWKLFVDSVDRINRAEKPLFRGIVISVKKTAENILTEKPHPFDHPYFDLPHYIYPYVDSLLSDNDHKFWEIILQDCDKLEKTTREVADNLINAATVVFGQVEAEIEAPLTYPIAIGSPSISLGFHIGEAINEYMGWR